MQHAINNTIREIDIDDNNYINNDDHNDINNDHTNNTMSRSYSESSWRKHKKYSAFHYGLMKLILFLKLEKNVRRMQLLSCIT